MLLIKRIYKKEIKNTFKDVLLNLFSKWKCNFNTRLESAILTPGSGSCSSKRIRIRLRIRNPNHLLFCRTRSGPSSRAIAFPHGGQLRRSFCSESGSPTIEQVDTIISLHFMIDLFLSLPVTTSQFVWQFLLILILITLRYIDIVFKGAHDEHKTNKNFGAARSKIKLLMVSFEPISKFPKSVF